MIRKIYIQLLLIFLLAVITFFLFFKYFKKTNIEDDLRGNIEQSINTSESLIENLKYLSTDKEGNEYKIEAKKGNIDKDNPDIIYLENVIAIIEGTEKPDEYLILTAHLDHVGYGRTGSRLRKSYVGEIKDRIHNGADDDGSGTVAMLEIAQAFKQASKKGKGPKRSIIFLHVTGEEKGLLGSAYYSDNPIYPLSKTVANLNLDMIGRIDPTRKGDKREYIYIIGSDHDSQDLHNISEQTNLQTVNIDLDYRYLFFRNT